MTDDPQEWIDHPMTSAAAPTAPTVQELLAEADRYTHDAMAFFTRRYLRTAPEMTAETREKARLWLRTGFLFSHLPQWQQSLLVTVAYHRQMLTRLVNIRQQSLSGPLRAEVERITSRAEHAFLDLIQETRNVIPSESLSAAQRAALEQEYLRIQFEDEASP